MTYVKIFPYFIPLFFLLPHSVFSAEPSRISKDRIITTSPALTELLFELGYGDHLVAASHYSDYPDKAKSLPRVGTLFSPSLEKTLSFLPDWVLIDSEATPTHFTRQLSKLQLSHLEISIHSVSDLFKEAEKILHLVFHQTQFKALQSLKIEFDNHKKKNRPFRFIALAWPSPITLIGSNTFLSDLLTQLGGKNILPKSLTTPYPQIAMEWLLKNSPDYLFILGDSIEQKEQTQKLSKLWWPHKNVKVILLSSDQFARTTFGAITNLPLLLEKEL
ncbi:MAG: hypothetical protein EXR74_03285 [Bdellovibrionales bacterium]|nr:hypothetical protein [Bdellovibrionales bacterium]